MLDSVFIFHPQAVKQERTRGISQNHGIIWRVCAVIMWWVISHLDALKTSGIFTATTDETPFAICITESFSLIDTAKNQLALSKIKSHEIRVIRSKQRREHFNSLSRRWFFTSETARDGMSLNIRLIWTNQDKFERHFQLIRAFSRLRNLLLAHFHSSFVVVFVATERAWRGINSHCNPVLSTPLWCYIKTSLFDCA